MSETTKSLIRHIMTGVGLLLGFIGLGKFTGLLEILQQNLDGLFAAFLSISGVVTMVAGFFRNKKRLDDTVPILVLLFIGSSFFPSNLLPVPGSDRYSVSSPRDAETGFQIFSHLSQVSCT